MQEVTVQLPAPSQATYTIHVGAQAIDRIGSLYDLGRYSKIAVVTDDAVGPVLLARVLKALPEGTASVTVPSGEQSKTIETIQTIWTALHEASCDRKSLVINLGGGVVGDIGGFAAGTYMRGVDFINVPTTLLAQVDSSVGGKTGFNFAGVKNLIGTFSQPAGVVIDPEVLSSLPDAELLSGFGEAIKHGAIANASYFDEVTAKTPQDFSAEELVSVIAGSCRIKAGIVQKDEKEGGPRKLLNFGHTVGHAVEALSLETDNPLPHGHAVSIGMTAEAAISHAQGLLSADDLEKLRAALTAAGLPVSVPGLSAEAVIKKMDSDKKNERGELNFTLLETIGRAVYDQRVPEPTVTEAVRAILA